MRKILVFLLIISILLSVVACVEETPTVKKQLCDYKVEFFLDGKNVTEDYLYLLDGISFEAYEGTEVDISENIIYNIPNGFLLDEENSVLWGQVKNDNSLKLSVHYKLDRDNIDYSFSGNSSYINYIAKALGESNFDGIVADQTASYGYALSATREKAQGGLEIDLGERNISDYERILVRVRITGSQTYQMLVDGETEICYLERGNYRVYDIKPTLDEKGIEKINSLSFYSIEEESGSVFVDSISFVNNETVLKVDPSYLVQRDESSYYISDFNTESVLSLAQTIGVNSKGIKVTDMSKLSWSFANNDKNAYNVVLRGLKVQVSAVSGFKYNLPTKFDLTKANEIVIRFTCDAWHGGYISSFFHFTSGNRIENIINYCKVYFKNGQGVYGDYSTTQQGTLDEMNYRRCTIVLDVDAFIKATGMTTIDGIIFGADKPSSFDTHYIDEIYYTVDSVDDGIERTDFVTGNIVPGGYYMEDTAHGLMITGTASTFATHTLTNAISGSDIKTLTVRYMESGSAQAIIKFLSGDKDIYFNLTKAKAGDAGVISKEVDEYGFSIIKLNFAELPSDSWTISDRGTRELTEIGIGSTHALATPIFDYVAYNE